MTFGSLRVTCNEVQWSSVHAISSAARVRKRRAALRKQGLRPVQIWVPDTRQPGFLEECRRQSRLVAEVERDDEDLHAFLDAALEEILKMDEP